MKSPALSSLFMAAAGLAMLSASALAGDRNGISFELDRNGKAESRKPLEERRIPAFQRIEKQLTPYVYEGRSTVRHDEVSSNVLSVHILASGGKAQLRAGHALAPNFDRLVRP
jgi:hypothetical protein